MSFYGLLGSGRVLVYTVCSKLGVENLCRTLMFIVHILVSFSPQTPLGVLKVPGKPTLKN